MANALVWMAVAATPAILLQSDSSIAPSQFLVIYLGRETVTDDPRFEAFTHSLERLPADLRNRVRLKHVAALPEMTRLEEAVSEAIQMRPAVIVAPSTATAKAVRDKSAPIPVLFSSFTDPVRSRVVDSMGQRTEPFTGVWMEDDLDGKRLEFLRDAYPQIRTVAVLMDRPWESNCNAMSRLPRVANSLGLDITVLLADDAEEVQRVLDDPQAAKFDAWYLAPSGMATLHAETVLARLRAWGKPVIVGRTQYVVDGAPISYMVDIDFRWPAMVELLTRVLRGEAPGSIPIQRPYRIVLAVRPTPAKGFPPPSAQVVRQADLVVR
ncbi:ABC transporter substrate binding protein [Pelomonas sp. Root1217]|uniref:ABC transporter substrate binding protein n=1 Tax=Pelomonas sp. Root1217 TaxID=1736430 RepID=UPI00138F62D8|nr:ABC transporter substrate binding protein [Pelomonas sp. Root1217]